MARRAALNTACANVAVGVFVIIGAFLAIATPVLLFWGTLAGSDVGSIGRGLVNLVGLPWVIYALSTALGVMLLVKKLPVFAAVVALCQLVPGVWVGMRFVG